MINNLLIYDVCVLISCLTCYKYFSNNNKILSRFDIFSINLTATCYILFALSFQTINIFAISYYFNAIVAFILLFIIGQYKDKYTKILFYSFLSVLILRICALLLVFIFVD
jgi:hypothetical protein